MAQFGPIFILSACAVATMAMPTHLQRHRAIIPGTQTSTTDDGDSAFSVAQIVVPTVCVLLIFVAFMIYHCRKRLRKAPKPAPGPPEARQSYELHPLAPQREEPELEPEPELELPSYYEATHDPSFMPKDKPDCSEAQQEEQGSGHVRTGSG